MLTPASEMTRLVHAARERDETAWRRLIARVDPIVRRIGRGYRLAPAELDDLSQATWLLAVAHLHRVRDPEAVRAWIATTARREALRMLQDCTQEWPTDEPERYAPHQAEGPDAAVIAAELRDVLGTALASLPPRHRALMEMLACHADYREISARLAMPIGSIGPLRARSLRRLERLEEVRALRD
jgi:RNA polymerase sigma factor (sigma-70 family)